MFQHCKIISRNTNPADYFARQAATRGQAAYPVSSSTLREITKCARRWVRGYDAPDSEAKDWGSLIDTLLLQPEVFAHRYIVRPLDYQVWVMKCPQCDSESKDSKTCRECKCGRVKTMVTRQWSGRGDYCQAWEERQKEARLETISQEWNTRGATAAKVFLSDPELKAFLEACDRQVWVAGEWADKATGVVFPVQCLIDLVPQLDTEFSKSLGDLKTTRNAGSRAFSSWAYNAGYHVQAAWNTDLYVAATGEDRCSWAWLIQENYEPYETGKRLADPDLIALGRQEYQWAASQYARRLADGKWPGYDEALPESDTAQGWGIIRAEQWMREKSFGLMYGELRETEPAFASQPDDVGPAASQEDFEDIIP